MKSTGVPRHLRNRSKKIHDRIAHDMKVPKQQRKSEKEEAESKKSSGGSESEIPMWAVALLLFVLLGSTVVGVVTSIMGGGLQ